MSTVQIAMLSLLIAALAAGAALGGTAGPDTLNYTVRPGDTLAKICEQHRHLTRHYTLTDLLDDIRRANGITSNHLSIGQRLRIPVAGDGAAASVRRQVADGAEVRGIYLAGPACAVSTVFERVDRFIVAGGNTVVFDAKDIDGGVTFRSRHPLVSWGAGRTAPLLPSLPDMIRRFDRRGLHVVARLALFLDGELGHNHPELALQDPAGEPWAERGCVWVDPDQPAVRDYNLTLAMELARAGVDEIQFDYVRFPTNGWRGDWTGDAEATAARRRQVISGFLAAARDSLSGLGVLISADLYGIMAWDRVEDLALTGQHVPTIAALVDVVCPMIYPSHFRAGFEGRERPGDDPAYFIGEGTRRFAELVAGAAEIRPWLQAFPYLVSDYDGDYIATQVTAARAAGSAGWCLWNPSCRYGVAVTALADLPGDAPLFAVVRDRPAPRREPVAREPERKPERKPVATAGGFYGTLVRTAPDDSRRR